jgi:hypothetical protein
MHFRSRSRQSQKDQGFWIKTEESYESELVTRQLVLIEFFRIRPLLFRLAI